MQSKLGTVVVGGGTGFIGSVLGVHLKKIGYNVVNVSRKSAPFHITWGDISENGLPTDTTAVVNMAGENVLNPLSRWTDDFQQTVRTSRIGTTEALAQAAAAALPKPAAFVSMSGVGYYQPSRTATYSEESEGGDFDFMSRLCTEWEAAADSAKRAGVRTVVVRSGVVLGRQGGMIQQAYLPFYFGLGGPIHCGGQYFPWIHVDDMARLLVYCIQQEKVEGVVNGVAPCLSTNAEFTRAFAAALHRLAFLPVPGFLIKLVFGGDRAVMLLEGQRVEAKRALQLGFNYLYPDLQTACQQLVA